ncbi:MAG TPA: glycine--tRNA ligase subunit beta, partial [Thermodesulfobacteriota bacterium]|nr:glycine--tRNA ligase subunit beta [Thermodesulfobacteriota bacterium]
KHIEGKETMVLLPQLLTKVVESIPFPKSMRWANYDLRFARPIQWLVALFDGAIVPFALENVKSSNLSWGHRFLNNQPFAVQNLDSLLQAAEAHSVILDPEKRKALIRSQAEQLAADVGGTVLEDEELLDEVANLVEFPVTLRGSFAPAFLDVPRDVLITSMREHQRYFAIVDSQNALLPYFIVVANNRAHDQAVVVKGNERVLTARLTDARFFFEEDRKTTLAARVEGLKQVVYQVKLGTLYEKTARLQMLMTYLASKTAPELAEKADRAALLCKTDLLTTMVGEFPALQGTMGREYALREGEDPEVAQALSEHYLPVSAQGGLPTSKVGALLSIADKMDSIVGCFGVGLIPTGTADPYALRRQALGIIRIILEQGLRLSLPELIETSCRLLAAKITTREEDICRDVLDFIRGRFYHRLTAQTYAYDVVEAVSAVNFADLVDVVARIEALQAMKGRPDFEPLAVAFKRIANIIAAHPAGAVHPELLTESAEKELHQAFQSREGTVRRLIASGDYAASLNELASLKPAVDGFFDGVLVMCDDERIKQNRLALLATIASLFRQIADFSKVVTEK